MCILGSAVAYNSQGITGRVSRSIFSLWRSKTLKVIH